MKAYQIICPACGATLDYDKKYATDAVYCTYCGKKIFLDSNVQRIEINKTVNYNKTFTDKAKIVEAESRERTKRNELEFKEREDKRNILAVFLCFGLLIFMTLFCLFMAHIEEKKSMPDNNEVKLTSSASDYKGENYEQIVKELTAAGFTNIETDEVNDIITGLITKEGAIEKISINGDSNFSSGEKFPKDSTIIITYHARKK